MSPRSSSGVRGIRLCRAPRALKLRLDLARELGELLQHLDRLIGVVRRLEPRARSLQPRQQRLGFAQRLFGVHAASSRWIRPRIPFTSLAASSDAYRFANATASSIATSAGT